MRYRSRKGLTVRKERFVSLGTKGIAIEIPSLSFAPARIRFHRSAWSSGYGNDPTRVSLNRVLDGIRHGEGERDRERENGSIDHRGSDLSEDRRPFLASSTTCDPPCRFVVRRGRSSSSLFCVRCEFLFGQPPFVRR